MKRIVAAIALVLAAAFTQAQERAHYYPPTTLGTVITPARHAKYLPPNDSYKAAILRDSPVAYWRMDAASGTTENDISAGGWTSTYHNGFTLNVAGALSDGDKAVSFDGTNGTFLDTNAIFNYAFGTGPVSVEFWFKTNGQAAQAGIIDDKTAGSNDAGFNVFVVDSGGQISCRIGNGTSQQSAATALGYKDNAWHQFVCVIARSATDTMQIYVDGTSVSGPANLVTGWNLTQSGVKLRIGAYNTGGSPNFFIGSVDDVTFYNTALTATQVANHYAARLFQ